jgi:hypothetical protein
MATRACDRSIADGREDKKTVKRLTRAKTEAAVKPGETYEQVKDRLSQSIDG